MKPQDEQEPLIPPDASIGNPARAQPRLRGSHSSQQPLIARRRPPGNGDDGPPDGDGEPPPPPPPVSVPDVAMQFSPCLPVPCAPTSSGPFATLRVGPRTCALSVRTSRSASAFGFGRS